MAKLVLLAAVAALCGGLRAQVIEFESGGLRFQTLSRGGVTVMFAHMPAQLKNFDVLQAVVSNGSQETVVVRPEDFVFERQGTARLPATSARAVVSYMLESASRNDVIRLVNAYESNLFGISRIRPTNGYELRRQQFLAEMGSSKLHAAAAASAIALVAMKLQPGQSTDGAVFFRTDGKPLGAGRLNVRAGALSFEFEWDPEGTTKTLRQRPETAPSVNPH